MPANPGHFSLPRATDITVVHSEDIGCHYVETLRRWEDNLGQHAATLPRRAWPRGLTVARPETRRVARWKLGGPFLLLHLCLVGVFFVGFSRAALIAFIVSYVARAFGITAFYHRCFAHRSFRVPRWVQGTGALLGASAAQRGPLWWVAHHRQHHLYTDRPGDPHSPIVDGFWHSHVLWIFDPDNAPTDLSRVRDLARFPELRLLDRYEYSAPGALAVACFGTGTLLAAVAPSTGTSGLQLVMWGFVVPTIALYHSTFSVNSLAHRFGRRRFQTADASRNNWLISAFVLGEGWHNNHHRFPNSARQGLTRFELDPTWWGIRLMGAMGMAWGVRRPPDWATSGHQEPAPASAAEPSEASDRLEGGGRPLARVVVSTPAAGSTGIDGGTTE